LIRIRDESLVVEEDPQPAIPFDNRRGTTPYEVKRSFAAEWSQTWELRREQHDATRAGIGAGTSGAKLEFAAEQAIKAAYALTETRRESRTNDLSFQVPAGVRRDVHVVHRQLWRHGVVEFQRGEEKVDIPFRVLTNVEIGYNGEDQGA
jgi:hypothetical protein